MRKTSCLSALAFLVLGSAAPTLTLAGRLMKANQKDISRLLEAATGTNIENMASLIGEAQDRVHFEYVNGAQMSSHFMNRPKRVVYRMLRTGITDEQLTQLKTCTDGQSRDFFDRHMLGE